ncbi:MAG: hypothetical protein LBN43_09680 [Oscillospiraceae bacterium]|jgi:hypothetical protein|nr:hypothetical protein [Oscillospiraceae bacterium]
MSGKNKSFLKFAPTLVFAIAAAAIILFVNNSVSGLLTLIVVLIAAVYVVFSAVGESSRYNPPDSLAGVFSAGSNKAAKIALISVGLALTLITLYSGILIILDLRTTQISGTKSIPDFIRAGLALLAAISFVIILAQSNFSDSESGEPPLSTFRACSFILTIYSCFNLILIYRRNATNPNIAEFAWQILAMAAFSVMWMYLMGITAGAQYRSIKAIRFFARMTVVLSMIAGAVVFRNEMAVYTKMSLLCEFAFCFLSASITDILMSTNAGSFGTKKRLFLPDDDEIYDGTKL